MRTSVAVAAVATGALIAGLVGMAPALAAPLTIHGISFSASATTVDVQAPTVALTIVLNGPTPNGTKVKIWDGRQVSSHSCSGPVSAQCGFVINRTVPTDEDVMFSAYLTTAGGWDSVNHTPTTDYEHLGSITVTNTGWNGTITSFTAVRNGANYYGTPTFKLVAALSEPVVTYRVSIVNLANGRLEATCTSGSTCQPSVNVVDGSIRPYEAAVSRGGYGGDTGYRGRVADRKVAYAYSGSQEQLAAELAKWAFVGAGHPVGSLTAGQFLSLVSATNAQTASATRDTATCLRYSGYLSAGNLTRSSTGDFYLVCSTYGLAKAVAGILGVVSVATVAAIIFQSAVDPDAPYDDGLDPSDCLRPVGAPATWCTEHQDDLWQNPGQPTHGDFTGAVNAPTAYSQPDEPWDPRPLRPRYTCFDGTQQWSCDGIPGEPTGVAVHELKDGSWQPQVVGAGLKPPVNCMFLNADGSLRLKVDGTINTSVRDARMASLLNKQGLQDTYEKHHIVTRYANSGDATRSALVEEMNEILADWALSAHESFNLVVIPHQGPHPTEYHEWVRDKLIEIDDEATSKAEFLQLFDERITRAVLTDPSIVLDDYWECYR